MYKENLPEDIKQIIWTTLIIFIALAIFIIVLFLLFNLKKNTLIKDKILMQTQFSQALLQTQIEIQEQTLKTISQEIHDNVGQVLSLAKLNLGTFENFESAYNQTKINDTKQLVSKAINDLRDLSCSMNGDKIADLGLKDAIENELKIIANTGQFATELKTTGEYYKLAAQNEMVIFRIVQESLNNAIKHSKAKNISVHIDYAKTYCKIAIVDDGKGFDALQLEATKTGVGLHNMKSRATLIGAHFSIEASINNGTTVFIELPNITA
jgi:two-component system, NarL family, sensor kinase